ENRGFDVSLNWRDQKGNFAYNVGIVGSTVNNKVLDLGAGNEAIFGGAVGISGLLGSRTTVGESIGHYYGYKTAGVFENQSEVDNLLKRGPEQPGDLRFQDTDGNGVVNSSDRVILGSPIPDYVFGFNVGFEYKGLDLRDDFYGTYSKENCKSKKQVLFNSYKFEISFLDRRTGEVTNNTLPRISNGGHDYEVSDRVIEDDSYLRLRNI